MIREDRTELLEQAHIPDSLAARAYRDMARIHRWLGDTRVIVSAIRRDPLPVERVLDVGCGTGLVVEEVGRALSVQVAGVDLRPRPRVAASVPILKADASRDPLPPADVAFSMYLGHHLSESRLADVICNVGRFCRRFILLDLVRHPLPLALFRLFVAPIVCRMDAEDGRRSLRRSYTPREFRQIAARAVGGTGARVSHSVAPFRIRQIIDISYRSSTP